MYEKLTSESWLFSARGACYNRLPGALFRRSRSSQANRSVQSLIQ
jgi:hypothetical protein